MFNELNQKYDNIENQHHRFLILLGLVLPGLVLIVIEAVTDNPVYWLVGMAYLLILLAIRLLYMGRPSKQQGDSHDS